MEKVVMTSAERQQKCRDKNPKKAALSQLKQNIKRQNMKDTDPEKGGEEWWGGGGQVKRVLY